MTREDLSFIFSTTSSSRGPWWTDTCIGELERTTYRQGKVHSTLMQWYLWDVNRFKNNKINEMSCLKEDVCISIIFIRISENLNLTVLGPVFQDFFSRCERVFQRMPVFKKNQFCQIIARVYWTLWQRLWYLQCPYLII